MFQGGATHPRVCDLRNAFQMSLECGLLESLSAHQYICTSAHQHYFAPRQLCGDDTNCRLGIVYNNRIDLVLVLLPPFTLTAPCAHLIGVW